MALPAGFFRRAVSSPTAAKLMLVACAVIWGSSAFMMKDATKSLPVFWLLAIRFGMAAVLMLVVFSKNVRAHLDRRTIGVGLLLGLWEWGGYAVQTVGLTMTTPGKSAFITGSYVVMVPFIAWAMGMGRPHRWDLAAAAVCLAGLGFVGLDGGGLVNFGDVLTVVCALLFALQFVEVARCGGELDIWALTAWQFIAMFGLSALLAVFEPVPSPATFTPPLVLQLVYFGVVCSFVSLAAMNYAVTRVPPAEGSLLACLESPAGVLFSVVAGHEILSGRLTLGFALIFTAVLISNGWPWYRERRAKGAEQPEQPETPGRNHAS